MEEFRAPLGNRLQILAVFPNHFFRHADRGQRGAQLVGNIGDETLLQAREFVVLVDCVFQGGRHVVEGGSQVGKFVSTFDVNAGVQISVGQECGSRCGTSHGAEDLIDRHVDRKRHQEDERDNGDGQNPHDHVDHRLVGFQGVDDVQLVHSRARDLYDPAGDDSRNSAICLGLPWNFNGLPLSFRIRLHALAQFRGDDALDLLIHDFVDSESLRGVGGAQQHDRDCPGTRAGQAYGGNHLACSFLNLIRCGRRRLVENRLG